MEIFLDLYEKLLYLCEIELINFEENYETCKFNYN